MIFEVAIQSHRTSGTLSIILHRSVSVYTGKHSVSIEMELREFTAMG